MFITIKNFEVKTTETKKGMLVGSFNVVLSQGDPKVKKEINPSVWLSGFKVFKSNDDKYSLLKPTIELVIGTRYNGEPIKERVNKFVYNKELQKEILNKAKKFL